MIILLILCLAQEGSGSGSESPGADPATELTEAAPRPNNQDPPEASNHNMNPKLDLVSDKDIEPGLEVKQPGKVCDECGKTFKQLKSFLSHKCGHKLQKVRCPSCDKEISRTNYAKHIRFHASTRYKCDLCSKKFKDEAKKTKHMKDHSDRRCNICGKQFSRNFNLKEHYKVHTIDKDSSVVTKSKMYRFCQKKVVD